MVLAITPPFTSSSTGWSLVVPSGRGPDPSLVRAVVAPLPEVSQHVEHPQRVGQKLARRPGAVLGVQPGPGVAGESSSETPKKRGVVVPARQTYSHSASVGSRYPVRFTERSGRTIPGLDRLGIAPLVAGNAIPFAEPVAVARGGEPGCPVVRAVQIVGEMPVRSGRGSKARNCAMETSLVAIAIVRSILRKWAARSPGWPILLVRRPHAEDPRAAMTAKVSPSGPSYHRKGRVHRRTLASSCSARATMSPRPQRRSNSSAAEWTPGSGSSRKNAPASSEHLRP